MIENIKELAEWYGTTVDALKKDIYKTTECGAWIDWTDESVTVGSIVEGSEAEFSREFRFPFSPESIEYWVAELEELCDEAWREAHYDFSYYRLLDGSDEVVTYEELALRLESQGTYDCYVPQEIEDLIDSGCLEGLSEDEAKPIWEEQRRRMKRCTDCACLESGEHGEWICGLDGKCVIQIEHCESVEKPSLLSTVYTEEDLKEMGL